MRIRAVGSPRVKAGVIVGALAAVGTALAAVSNMR